jgi:hypothetical protein
MPVEKNGAVVRKLLGYRRFEGHSETKRPNRQTAEAAGERNSLI